MVASNPHARACGRTENHSQNQSSASLSLYKLDYSLLLYFQYVKEQLLISFQKKEIISGKVKRYVGAGGRWDYTLERR